MTNANDLAFSPTRYAVHKETVGQFPNSGLTKREYLAGLAMQGLCANSIPGQHHDFAFLAGEAVRYADFLINELNKDTK